MITRSSTNRSQIYLFSFQLIFLKFKKLRLTFINEIGKMIQLKLPTCVKNKARKASRLYDIQPKACRGLCCRTQMQRSNQDTQNEAIQINASMRREAGRASVIPSFTNVHTYVQILTDIHSYDSVSENDMTDEENMQFIEMQDQFCCFR